MRDHGHEVGFQAIQFFELLVDTLQLLVSGTQLPIGRLQLSGALGHPGLQLPIEFADLRLDFFPDGDVAQYGRATDHLALFVCEQRHGQIHDDPSPLLSNPLRLVVLDKALLLDAPGQQLQLPLLLQFLRHQDAEGVPDDLLFCVAEDQLCPSVPGLDHPLSVEADDGVGRGGGDAGQILLVLSALLLGPLLLGQVAGDPGQRPPGDERSSESIDQDPGAQMREGAPVVEGEGLEYLVSDHSQGDQNGQGPSQQSDRLGQPLLAPDHTMPSFRP